MKASTSPQGALREDRCNCGRSRLDAEIEQRFWHAAYLTVVDADTLQWEAVPASAVPSMEAAGKRLALLATYQHVLAAISNDYGPHCYSVLESAGIPMYLAGKCKTVREAVEAYRADQLPAISAPTSTAAQVSAAK